MLPSLPPGYFTLALYCYAFLVPRIALRRRFLLSISAALVLLVPIALLPVLHTLAGEGVPVTEIRIWRFLWTIFTAVYLAVVGLDFARREGLERYGDNHPEVFKGRLIRRLYEFVLWFHAMDDTRNGEEALGQG